MDHHHHHCSVWPIIFGKLQNSFHPGRKINIVLQHEQQQQEVCFFSDQIFQQVLHET